MRLVRRILRDDSWKLIAYSVILLGNVFLTVLTFPTFESNYLALLNLVPGFMKSLKGALLDAGSGGLPDFAAINHLFKGTNVIGAAVAILLATGAIVREVEIGSIGMLLSRPWSRRRILLSFAITQILELAVPMLLATVALPLVASLCIQRDVPLTPLLRGAVHSCAFLALIYSVTLFVSILITEQLKVAGIAGGALVVSFVLYFIDATRPYTLYRFSTIETYAALAKGGALDVVRTGGLYAAAAVFVGLALRAFSRRDY